LIKAVVLVLDGVITAAVFDGMPSEAPSNLTYVVIGGTLDPAEDVATMSQDWGALGRKKRDEELDIQCLAVGRASRIPEARTAAIDVIAEVGTVLPPNPTPLTYNTLISEVSRMQAANSQAGATVHVQFTIHSRARLLP
jgi:hypothetical protein